MNQFELIDLNGVEGVLLDLDNTLYPYEINHLRSLKICEKLAYEKYDIQNMVFKEWYNKSRSIVHKELQGQAASHSRLLYFHKLHELGFSVSNPEFAIEMEELYWSEFLDGMELNSEAESFLFKLKKQDIRTCIVTDLTSNIQFRKWIKLNLGRLIDYIVTSEEAGIEKPDKKIFELALKKMGLDPQSVIMIGDNLSKDIHGAEMIGIKSYLVNV